MNYNKVMLGGRLTREPELRRIPSGTAVLDLGLAVNRVTTRDGVKHEETCFVDLVAWERQAETIAKYLHKGDPIFVEGRLQLDTWTDKGGAKRNRLRVVVERFEFVGGRTGDATPSRAPVAGEESLPPADETIPF